MRKDDMRVEYRLLFVGLIVGLLASGAFGPVRAQTGTAWPFQVTAEDLALVQTDSVRWLAVRSFVGGMEGRVAYLRREPAPGECRAVALLAAGRLRNRYQTDRETPPVRLQLDFRCGERYEGTLRYDGVNVHLEQREPGKPGFVYRGRARGLTAIP